MDRHTLESIRKHGAKARAAGLGGRKPTRVTFESGSQVYLWVTERGSCRLASGC